MQKVYLVPTEIDQSLYENLVGTEGTRINLVEDIDGNHIVSLELGDSPEFAVIRAHFEELGHSFTKIDYKPIDYRTEYEKTL